MMLNKNTEYWLYLEPYVYMFQNDDETLIANTLDNKKIYIKDVSITSFMKQIYEPHNGGVIKLDVVSLSNPKIFDVIIQLMNHFMAYVISIDQNPHKPFQMIPKLNIQKVILKKHTDNMLINNITSYLNEVRIILYDDFKHGDYISFLHCTKDEMPLETLESIFSQLPYKNLHCLQLFGNPDSHSKSEQLYDIINKYNLPIYYNIHYTDAGSYLTLKEHIKNNKLKVYVDFPIENYKWDEMMNLLCQFSIDADFIFLIKNEIDYINMEKYLTKFKIENYSIQFIFRRENLDFFEKYTYLSKDDIESSTISMREIFINQSINIYDFGKLSFLPNGDAYGNLKLGKIGNITTDSLKMLIYSELNNGNSWLRIRNQAPCNKCIYQWLCPSPSDYELEIGKPNLCHVKP